jgi:hypothetical protein
MMYFKYELNKPDGSAVHGYLEVDVDSHLDFTPADVLGQLRAAYLAWRKRSIIGRAFEGSTPDLVIFERLLDIPQFRQILPDFGIMNVRIRPPMEVMGTIDARNPLGLVSSDQETTPVIVSTSQDKLIRTNDEDYRLRDTVPSVWIEVGNLVAWLQRRDGGLNVSVFRNHDEDSDPIDELFVRFPDDDPIGMDNPFATGSSDEQ